LDQSARGLRSLRAFGSKPLIKVEEKATWLELVKYCELLD